MNKAGVISRLVARQIQLSARGLARKSPRDLEPMVYPYTYTGKIAQFPWVYNFKNAFLTRYLVYSALVCYPLFVFIHFKVNSPEAKIAWETKKKQDFEKEHKHEWDI